MYEPMSRKEIEAFRADHWGCESIDCSEPTGLRLLITIDARDATIAKLRKALKQIEATIDILLKQETAVDEE